MSSDDDCTYDEMWLLEGADRLRLLPDSRERSGDLRLELARHHLGLELVAQSFFVELEKGRHGRIPQNQLVLPHLPCHLCALLRCVWHEASGSS